MNWERGLTSLKGTTRTLEDYPGEGAAQFRLGPKQHHGGDMSVDCLYETENGQEAHSSPRQDGRRPQVRGVRLSMASYRSDERLQSRLSTWPDSGRIMRRFTVVSVTTWSYIAGSSSRSPRRDGGQYA